MEINLRFWVLGSEVQRLKRCNRFAQSKLVLCIHEVSFSIGLAVFQARGWAEPWTPESGTFEPWTPQPLNPEPLNL